MSRKILITTSKIQTWYTEDVTKKDAFSTADGWNLDYDSRMGVLRIVPNLGNHKAVIHISDFTELDDVYGTADLEEFANYLMDNNFFSPASGGSDAKVILYKTADEAKTEDVVVAIDADLQLELEANSEYYFELRGWYVCANGVPDLLFGFDTPVGSTGGYQASLAGSLAEIGFGVNTMLAGSAFNETIFAWGNITTVGAGTFGLKWAQNASSTNHTTLLKNTQLLIRKIN